MYRIRYVAEPQHQLTVDHLTVNGGGEIEVTAKQLRRIRRDPTVTVEVRAVPKPAPAPTTSNPAVNAAARKPRRNTRPKTIGDK